MAMETQRKRARKNVKLPGGTVVSVPVITEISFIDPRDRYQETVYSVDNTPQADREVHVDDVYPTSTAGVQDTSGQPLRVERIDNWKVLDARDRYQESHHVFDNRTGADLKPPSFTTHQKKHVYRYYADPNNPDDSGAWIDSELIDEVSTVDPRDRYQEKIHSLTNPENGDTSGQADPGDPDISDADGVPTRTDPFQNIVNFSAGETEWHVQKFIFRRWVGEPHNAGFPGDFYPITDDFYDTIHAANEVVYDPMDAAYSTGGREKRSDLIDAALHLSILAWPNSPTIGGSFAWTWQFWSTGWFQPRSVWPEVQPSMSNPIQLGIHAVYFVATGIYQDDDMDTNDWANLAAGTGRFSDVPQFVPPP